MNRDPKRQSAARLDTAERSAEGGALESGTKSARAADERDERRAGALFGELADDEHDGLDGGRVLAVLRRTLPLLIAVWPHLVAYLVFSLVLLLAGIQTALLFYDAFWQGVAQGAPIHAGTARAFGLDPALFSGAAALAQEARFLLRDRVLIGLAVAAPVLGLPTAALGYYQLWILQKINQNLRVRLLEKMQSLSLRFHAGARVGDSIYRVYQDSATVTAVIRTLILEPAYQGLLVLAGVLSVAAGYSVGLALLLLAAFPGCIWVASELSPRMRGRFRRSREANSDLTARVQETLAGIKVIKAFGAEAAEHERFAHDSQRAFAESFRARSLFAVYGVFMFWVVGVLLVGLTGLAFSKAGGQGGSAAQVAGAAVWTLGVLQSLQFVSGVGSLGIEGLFSLWGRAQDVAVGLDRVFEMLDLEPEVSDAPDAVSMPALHDGIRFEHVSFAYEPERPVLHDVSFEALPGTITAIVGPTGSGKSTLMSLLLRLFDPESGHVRIEDVDLRRIRLQSLREHVAIALQENVLFDASVKDNIRYAVPNAREDQVLAAAAVACADEFIRDLPARYDTAIGERGAKLSTGQRQRISIARAILKDAPVLILDEPTAALDAETELRLMESLAFWGKDRIVFIATHRLSTIRRADQILFLQDGHVLERGSHAELMRRHGGAYRRLVELEESVLQRPGAQPQSASPSQLQGQSQARDARGLERRGVARES